MNQQAGARDALTFINARLWRSTDRRDRDPVHEAARCAKQNAMRQFALAALLVFATIPALSQDVADRDAWRADIAAQRARAEAERVQLKADLARRKAETIANPVSRDLERARQASDQVLNDYSLQRGDIVSTVNGLFVFIGSGEGERTAADFVPIAPVPRR